MSTRCQIKIEGSKVYIYQHSDGYPDGPHGVLAALVPFRDSFFEGRGHDPDYFTARCVAMLVARSDVGLAEWRKRNEPNARPVFETLGFGVDTVQHGDIEYLYLISKTGAIEVRHGNEYGGWTVENIIPLRKGKG